MRIFNGPYVDVSLDDWQHMMSLQEEPPAIVVDVADMRRVDREKR